MIQFLRNIEVKIESWDGKTKIFSHNPKEAIQFAIEFDVEFDKSNLTTISLYNVLNSTVEMCAPKTGKNKSDTELSRAELSVGYGDDLSVIAKGEILQHNVKTNGPNRILEFKISDLVNKLFSFAVTMTFERALVSSILNQLFAKYGISYFALRFSEDVILDKISFSGESLDSVINQLAKRVKAHKYFKLGRLIVEDDNWTKEHKSTNVVLLDRTSGLIGTPSKTKSGWKVKSLLNPLIHKGETVHLRFQDNTTNSKIDSPFIVVKGHHKGGSMTPDYFTEFECKVG
ncbi:phage protein [Leptospira noguchii]|uniref:phage protein n=1 Tax=Leptospira noguchii TaxID=28182 RepID=UPI0018AD3026